MYNDYDNDYETQDKQISYYTLCIIMHCWCVGEYTLYKSKQPKFNLFTSSGGTKGEGWLVSPFYVWSLLLTKFEFYGQ